MAILKKSDILKGIENVEKVTVEELGGEIYLRPLSQAEVNDVGEIEAAAMGTFETNEKSRRTKRQKNTSSDVSSTGKVNLAKTTKANNAAKVRTVALSLNNSKYPEGWDEEEVAQIPAKSFKIMYEKVREISGMDDEDLDDEVEDFPEN